MAEWFGHRIPVQEVLRSDPYSANRSVLEGVWPLAVCDTGRSPKVQWLQLAPECLTLDALKRASAAISRL